MEEAARKDGKRGKGMVWREGGRREEGTEVISMCLYNYNLIQYVVVCANPDRCFQLSCQGG